MNDLFGPLRQTANEIRAAVQAHRGRGYSGQRETQYHLDLAADDVAVRVLTSAGFRVVSEESGSTGEGDYVVVVDPIDGSTNCDRGVPFFCTSLAVMRDGRLVAALVQNQATGECFEAELGGGATKDGEKIHASRVTRLSEAVCSFSGHPERNIGWAQSRSLGAAALEISLVACGALDLYGVAQRSTLNPWDYLGGLLILREAGGVASDYHNEELEIDVMHVRHPVFTGTTELMDAVREIGVL